VKWRSLSCPRRSSSSSAEGSLLEKIRGCREQTRYKGVIQQNAPAGLGVQSWAVKGAFFAHITLASMHVPPADAHALATPPSLPPPSLLRGPPSAAPASRPGPASVAVRQQMVTPDEGGVLQSWARLGAVFAQAPLP
jgi:hypothetical protein